MTEPQRDRPSLQNQIAPLNYNLEKQTIPLGGKRKNKPKIRYVVPNFSLLFSLGGAEFGESGGFRALRSAGISLRARSDRRFVGGSRKTPPKVLSKLSKRVFVGYCIL